MRCPKCHGHMESVHRSGTTIEICSNCHGIFLDRGELEHLVAAEGQHYANQGYPAPGHQAVPGYPPPSHHEPAPSHHEQRRHHGFLSEFFREGHHDRRRHH